MATVDGVYSSTYQLDDFRANQSTNIKDANDHVIVLGGWVGVSSQAGTLVTDQPVSENPVFVIGQLGKSHGGNSDFYNRILIEPSDLDLGNVLSTQTRLIRVWNGFLVNKTMSDFQRQGDAGTLVDEPVSPPYVMQPLEELLYVVSVTTNGPAVVNAELTWTIDGANYLASISGRRVVVFPFGPNWSSGVTESLEWRTDVLRAFDGSEQRRSLRTKARRSLEYRTQLYGKNAQVFENLLWGWQNRLYAVPVWSDKPRLIGDQLGGDTVLSLPTDTYSFAAGGLAIVFADPDDYEVVEIDSVTSGAVTLTRPLERSWPQNTLVYPAVLGHLPTAVPTQRLTGSVLQATMSFITSPVETDPYTPDAAAPTTYEGLDVLTRQPNWVRSLDNTFDYKFDVMDQITGAINWDPTEDFPRILRKYSWLLRDRDQILAFRQLLGRLRGQAKTLWIPSWHLDFNVVADIGSADGAISVTNNLFEQLVGLDPARNRICLRTEDGQTFYRALTGVSRVGDELRLAIDQPIGVSVPLSNVRALHLLMRNRLATDKVDIQWRSDEVAVVETTFTTVLE